MAHGIDTNIFLRLIPKSDPDRQAALEALRRRRARGETLYYTTQVLAEFWVVCTRPITARSGYGLTPAQTEQKARIIERYCHLLPDSFATHQEWRRLIVAHAVHGAMIHDTRIVAAMHVYGVTHLLTINQDDFARFTESIFRCSCTNHHSRENRDAPRNPRTRTPGISPRQ